MKDSMPDRADYVHNVLLLVVTLIAAAVWGYALLLVVRMLG